MRQAERGRHRQPEPVLLGEDSTQEPVLSIVLPTLNEEAGIETCIDRIKSAIAELGITAEVIVSDSSMDRTPIIAHQAGAIVVEPDEQGYGYAYRYGFERARGEYIAMGDADTTYDFEELPKLLELVANGDADIALGSRLNGEIEDGAMPALHRYVGNPLLTRFLNTFYDTDVTDAHSGLRVLSRDALERMNLETDGMEFASEMIMEAGVQGLDIQELPITYSERAGEATLESFKDGWRHVRFMLINAPGYLFSIPGVLLGSLGLLIMNLAFWGIPVAGFTLGPHFMIAGCLLTIVGFQIGSFGLFATIAGDPIRRPNDPVTRWLITQCTLERVAPIGTSMFLAGSGYAVYLVFQWIGNGTSTIPFLMADIVAFTAIVIGLQTVFSAFFMSAIAE